MTITSNLELPDAIAAIEHNHPGWHIWQTRSGRIWAATTASDYSVGSGTTLDTTLGLEAIERAIGEWDWQHARLAGAA